MHRALAPVVALVMAGAAAAQGPVTDVLAARYGEPTTRYPHGVLGDEEEWGALILDIVVCPACAEPERRQILVRLPETRVFEDVAPRLADVDDDGLTEVVVVESDRQEGGRLAIYDADGLVAATPFIGQRFRWLAPVGTGDLDGDGRTELAYVDRPHLARTLRVWRMDGGDLVELGSLQGVTNHRIGERDIAGGIRDCGDGPEMILADAGWTRLLAVRFDGGSLSPRDIGPHEGRASFARALDCAP